MSSRKGYKQIAKRYAQALFDALQENKGNLESLYAQSKVLLKVFDHDVQYVFLDPSLADSVKIEWLKEVATKMLLPDQMTNLLTVLVQNRRFAVIQEVLEDIIGLCEESLNIQKVHYTFAQKPEPQLVQDLNKSLETATRKKVTAQYEEDPSILAGVVVQIGNNIIDASLKARLMEFQHSLTQGV